MGKKKKRHFQRFLCGMLCSAMIAASLIVPDMTAYAAPTDGMETEAPSDDGGQMSEVPENEGGESEEIPDAGDHDAASEEAGAESGSGSDSDGGADDDSGADGIGTDDGSGESSDEDEDDGNVPGNDSGQDEPQEDNDESVTPVEEAAEELPANQAVRAANGALENGDFTSHNTDGEWMPTGWSLTGGAYKAEGGNPDAYVESTWNASGDTEFSISQVIENFPAGDYTLSVDINGDYDQDTVYAKIEKLTKVDDEYTTSGDPLLNESMGSSSAWSWNSFTSEKVTVPENVDAIKVSFAGTLGASKQIKLDNVGLKPFSDEPTEKMFYFYFEPEEGETAPLELGVELRDGKNNHSISTSETEKLADTNYYKMSPLGEKDAEGNFKFTYTDWYQIPLTVVDEIANEGSDVGFTIYKKAADGTTEEKAKFSGWTNQNTDIYAMLLESGTEACAVKNWKGYADNKTKKDASAILRSITLYAYNVEITPVIQLNDKSASTTLSVVDETTGSVSTVTPSGKEDDKNNLYDFKPVAGKENWYSLSFSVPGSIALKGESKCCGLYQKDSDGLYDWVIDLNNGPGTPAWAFDISPVFSGNNWLVFSGQGAESFEGKLYASQEEAEATFRTILDRLKELIEQAQKLKEEDYKEGWEEFQKKLDAAVAIAAKEEAADEEIKMAYDELKAAMDALVLKTQVSAEINVKPVDLPADFALGADLSSYISLRESGVEFKDENGRPLSDSEFFKYMYDGGTNWVRIRVWNDPYDAKGNGYGGGNNDLDKAKKIGKLASDAGMKVLIDFHYSDFWADPNKQKAPKAWAGMDLETKAKALYDFTYDSLVELRNAGVNVCMVQVGNETNNGIGGETELGSGSDGMGRLFAEGAKAVRAFDEKCLVAVHFTDAHKGFSTIAGQLKAAEEKYDFTYDVFASSFYPFGHGDTANLKRVLADVAKNYGKLVMAAETSWPTTLIDGDGLGYVAQPVIPKEYETQDYGISVQGQADEMRDLVDKVNQINSEAGCEGKAIGVFYWEPAWISPYYIKDENGNDNMELYHKNQALWEKYGSGWASSYAAEYDPDDAGVVWRQRDGSLFLV